VLWAYFDESFEHVPNAGKQEQVRIGVGGSIAPESAWAALEPQWAKAIEDEGVSAFHATEFYGRQGEFVGWSNSRRDAFLTRLLDAADEHIGPILGAQYSLSVPPRKIRAAYIATAWQALMGALLEAHRSGDRLSVVYALFPKVSEQVYRGFFRAIDRERMQLATVTTGSPTLCPRLQVADLLAYEVRKFNRFTPLGKRRYPLRRLTERHVLQISPTYPMTSGPNGMVNV
jgi:hypothetical protein